MSMPSLINLWVGISLLVGGMIGGERVAVAADSVAAGSVAQLCQQLLSGPRVNHPVGLRCLKNSGDCYPDTVHPGLWHFGNRLRPSGTELAKPESLVFKNQPFASLFGAAEELAPAEEFVPYASESEIFAAREYLNFLEQTGRPEETLILVTKIGEVQVPIEDGVVYDDFGNQTNLSIKVVAAANSSKGLINRIDSELATLKYLRKYWNDEWLLDAFGLIYKKVAVSADDSNQPSYLVNRVEVLERRQADAEIVVRLMGLGRQERLRRQHRMLVYIPADLLVNYESKIESGSGDLQLVFTHRQAAENHASLNLTKWQMRLRQSAQVQSIVLLLGTHQFEITPDQIIER